MEFIWAAAPIGAAAFLTFYCLEPGVLVKRAVDINEIQLLWLKAGMRAGSQHWSISSVSTARVVWRAVAFYEIFSAWLKAEMRPGSHHWPVRGGYTARASKRAVDFFEISSEQVRMKIWFKQFLPLPSITINKSDCFQVLNFIVPVSGLCQ